VQALLNESYRNDYDGAFRLTARDLRLWIHQPEGHAFHGLFFMACLATGFWVIDRLDETFQRKGSRPLIEMESNLWSTIREDWILANRQWKLLLIAELILCLALLQDLFIFGNILRYATAVLDLAHEGWAGSLLEKLFLMVGEDGQTAPFEIYRLKLVWFFGVYGRLALFLIGAMILVTSAKRVLPTMLRRLFAFNGRTALIVILSGFQLGFTISIRVVAGFVGLLVSGYWLYRYKSKVLGLLLLY